MDLPMTQYNSTLNRGFNSLDESCIFFNGWTLSLEKKNSICTSLVFKVWLHFYRSNRILKFLIKDCHFQFSNMLHPQTIKSNYFEQIKKTIKHFYIHWKIKASYASRQSTFHVEASFDHFNISPWFVPQVNNWSNVESTTETTSRQVGQSRKDISTFHGKKVSVCVTENWLLFYV